MGTFRTGHKYTIGKNSNNMEVAMKTGIRRTVKIFCSTNGKEYKSIKDAADQLKMHQSEISLAIKLDKEVKGHKFNKRS